MWRIDDIHRRRARLDFSSSGQGEVEVVQLVADDTVFANAANLTDWSEDPFQLEVCEACGVVRCEPGGWLSVRRSGDFIVLPPAFKAILEDRSNEYEPPRYTRQGRRGVPVMARQVYERLLDIVALPSVDDLLPLSGVEAVYLAQWNAPCDMLGTPYEPVAFRHGVAVAASEGTPEQWAPKISQLIEATRRAPTAVIEESVGDPVVLYLDLPGLPEWPFFVRNRGTLAWFLEPELSLVPLSGRTSGAEVGDSVSGC